MYAMVFTRKFFFINDENEVQRNFPKVTHNQRRKVPCIWTIIRLFAYFWGYCSPYGQQPLSLHLCLHNWLYDYSSPSGIHCSGWRKPQCWKILKKSVRSKMSKTITQVTADALPSDHGLWRSTVIMVLKYPWLSHYPYFKMYKA